MLELVEFGVVAHERQHPVDRLTGECAVAIRAAHEAHEDRVVVDDEGGDTEHVETVHAPLVLLADDLGRPTGVDLGQHGVGIDACPGEYGVDHLAAPQVRAVDVACVEQRPVDGQEVLGKAVPHGDAGGKGEQVGLMGRVVPRVLALGAHALVEEVGHERHVPVGSRLEAVEQVLVAIAGEGAPVVPGHGKGRRSAHEASNPTVGGSIPRAGSHPAPLIGARTGYRWLIGGVGRRGRARCR